MVFEPQADKILHSFSEVIGYMLTSPQKAWNLYYQKWCHASWSCNLI